MRAFRNLILLAILLAGAALYLLRYDTFGPQQETFVDIPSGTSSSGIAQKLASAGVIRSQYLFLAERKLSGGTLHAGVYRFDHPVTLTAVYRTILRGEVYTKAVTIPEGYNLFDIASAVQTAGLGTSAAFLAAAHRDTALIQDLSPHATSLEGYLFPDTYRFSPHTTPDQMLEAMVKRFRQVAQKLNLQQSPDLARTVILASLIEKEVSVPAERPLVAGVFLNRLSVGMPLATDPSVIYAALLDHRWRGTIYQSDLASESPYNTYRHPGLPPGPIANPGLAALRAALTPTPTNYLYFVADAQGHTQFSVSLADHARQVQQYRKSLAH